MLEDFIFTKHHTVDDAEERCFSSYCVIPRTLLALQRLPWALARAFTPQLSR